MAKQEFTPSLQEVNASVDTAGQKGRFRRLFAFIGPAYLISVGYMDPGNWATDLAGGSKFGYSLLWVLLMSNLIALLLQSLSARLGIVRKRDLAQASREMYPMPVNICLYVLAEIAIAACDLAEVLGMAIGLQLLFGISLTTGVLITVLDTFLLLFLLHLGMRKMEAFIFTLVFIIGVAFLTEIFFAKPDLAAIAGGFIPTALNHEALLIAIGIIGATVMPHNLYLHSSLVQTRKIDTDRISVKRAIRLNIFDSTIALNMAFFVNAAILILAASVFYKNGMYEVAEIQDAHKLLAPMLGTNLAPILFAVALIAAGQSSTITGTLAGQIVMEGYINLRIHPWVRRLLTRCIAIAPALIVIHIWGESSTGRMLILSQVVLSLQLGFAIIPLIHFVSDKKKMGEFAIKPLVKMLAWLSAIVIVALNIKLVADEMIDVFNSDSSVWLKTGLFVICIGVGLLLLITTLLPIMLKRNITQIPLHNVDGNIHLRHQKFTRIAVAVDFTESDNKSIQHAIAMGGKDAQYLFIHIVESAGAWVAGKEIDDYETEQDEKNLSIYARKITDEGFHVETKIGFGSPKKNIPEFVKTFHADLLVMGSHGHGGLKDFLLGTTVESVRHEVNIPVLVV